MSRSSTDPRRLLPMKRFTCRHRFISPVPYVFHSTSQESPLDYETNGHELFTIALDPSLIQQQEGSSLDARHRCCHSWAWNALRTFFLHHIPQKLTTSVYCKWWGSQVPAPPSFSVEQTLWIMVGTFVTIDVLAKLNSHIMQQYGASYQIVLPHVLIASG
jgi:hypothetical protein